MAYSTPISKWTSVPLQRPAENELTISAMPPASSRKPNSQVIATVTVAMQAEPIAKVPRTAMAMPSARNQRQCL